MQPAVHEGRLPCRPRLLYRQAHRVNVLNLQLCTGQLRIARVTRVGMSIRISAEDGCLPCDASICLEMLLQLSQLLQASWRAHLPPVASQQDAVRRGVQHALKSPSKGSPPFPVRPTQPLAGPARRPAGRLAGRQE